MDAAPQKNEQAKNCGAKKDNKKKYKKHTKPKTAKKWGGGNSKKN